MYASLSGSTFSDASPDSAFTIQSTIPRPVTQISPAPTSVVKTEVPLQDMDNVRAFPWTSFLDTGSETPFAF